MRIYSGFSYCISLPFDQPSGKGSNIAKRLYDRGGYVVRIIDIESIPPTDTICHEFLRGNLCDISTCIAAARGATMILHFAANMGGMGTIHGDNDAEIYAQNHTMTQNILKAASLPGSTVTRFFFASSACIYPQRLQNEEDVSLKESDVFAFDGSLPNPQGLYGLEKLNSELLVAQYADRFEVRIARFHNIYGPGGSWNNGREKAPAALLRKALACRRLSDRSLKPPSFEIWGDGTQRRSFLFIDDAVDALLKLLFSSCSEPVNIGSDQAVTIQELAEIALGSAEAQAEITYDANKPVGVASRNSNNEKALAVLDWRPSISLQEGMRRTSEWIQIQLDNLLSEDAQQSLHQEEILRTLLRSKVIDLAAERLTFAIILPITSRGLRNPNDCLVNLRSFCQTLKDTTWRDVEVSSDQKYRFVIYLAVDAEDTFLRQENKAHEVILDLGVPPSQIREIVNFDHPKGHVCALWRDCAREAYKDGCDYFVLMGDDVTLLDEGWMRKCHSTFSSLSESSGIPFGLACVAFTDVTFPGMPTFPIIHKSHMEVFGGHVVPEVFVNQDGDPFLFQLYRRWGTSVMLSCRLKNGVGGSIDARYNKQHVEGWSLTPLLRAECAVTTYLRDRHGFATAHIENVKKLTLDVIIPCYRVNLEILSTILSLEAPSSTAVTFIIIIDSPNSSSIPALLARYSSNPNVRIRVNDTNRGASYSRNRGLEEASADWVHFLDDDIIPSSNLLFAVSDAIRGNPDAAGFVCNTQFPTTTSVFTTAVHLAGVTYFWDIATKTEVDVPWGVTANLVSRRVLIPKYIEAENEIPTPTTFSLAYPKTGGGEDIDYCLLQRANHQSVHYKGSNIAPGFFPAPDAIVEHPWWDNGKRSYWRFHKWSIGDGHLIDAYPDLSYQDYTPNSAECFLVTLSIFCFGIVTLSSTTILFSIKLNLCIFAANVIHDIYRHLFLHPDRNVTLKIDSRIRRNSLLWTIAIIESSLIRMFSELGRLRGIVERREWGSIGKRFDWFVGRVPGDRPRKEERRNSVERVGVIIVLLLLLN